MDYLKVIVAGNLGADAELRYTPSNRAVCNFSIASNRRYTTSEGEQREETVWVRAALWGPRAESLHPYLVKGKTVLVEGRLNADENGNPRVFQRQDGSYGASYEITALDVRLGGGGNGATNGATPEAAGQVEDEIPF